MGIVKRDEIRGYLIESEVVCLDCASEKETNDIKGDRVLTEDVVDGDDLYFCDRCQNEL